MNPHDTHVCRDCGVTLAAVRDWMQFGAGDGTEAAEAESEALLRRIAAAYAARSEAAAPPLDEPDRTDVRDGVPLEWSRLTRALDAVDDVMMSRGHRLSSYSNEEYAAALRAELRSLA